MVTFIPVVMIITRKTGALRLSFHLFTVLASITPCIWEAMLLVTAIIS